MTDSNSEGSQKAPSITASAFTSALSQAANGVSIVSTSDSEQRAGLTVSSMCSVCADPALILVCVNLDNEFCQLATKTQHFAVNILPSSCVQIAQVFAGLTEINDGDRFNEGEWTTLTTGAPILSNALVALDCELDSSFVKGTHRVFFGKVIDVRTTSGEPLLYTDRRFAVVQPVPL